MTGLFKKDFLNIFRGGKYIFVLCLVFGAVSFATNQVGMLATMVVLLFTMLAITSFSFDEMAKWDKYAMTLPITRSEMVLEKYLLSLLMNLTGSALVLLLQVVSNAFGGQDKMPMQEGLTIVYVMFAACVLFTSVILPLIYKFGVEKSRIMLLLVVFLPTLLVTLLVKFDMVPSAETLELLLRLSPVVIAAALLSSFALSCSIFNRKEL